MPAQTNPTRNQRYSNWRPRGRGNRGRRPQRKQRGRRGRRGGRSINGSQIAGMLASAGFKYLFNTEDKYLDDSFSASVDTTGATMLINGMTQGTGVSNRLGDEIRIVRFLCNISLTISASATTTFARVIIFRDEQCDGAGPGFTSNLLLSASYNALYNPTYSKRFFVFFDKIIALNSNGDECWVFDFNKTLGFHTRYGLGNAGTIADIATNSFYVAYISDQATNKPTLALNSRMLFVDN